MEDTVIWLTYHDDKQIKEFNIKEDGCIKLFKGNDINVSGDNINHLNRYYSEIVTLYYVWKNCIESKFVGFCHYRRKFSYICEMEKGECQVLGINYNNPVFSHYKVSHNYLDLYSIIDLLNDKYGERNKYSEYLLKGNIFVPYWLID